MELGINKAKLLQYKTLAEKHLSDPVKLRLVTVFFLLIIAIVAIYMPYSKKISENKKLFSTEKERNGYIIDLEKLRKQSLVIQAAMNERYDADGWAEYLLDGLRKFQVRLKGMEARQQKKIGPYNAATLSVEVEGPYPELKQYIEWVESSGGLIRIDSLQFEKTPKTVVMKTLVLGIIKKK